MNRAYRMRKIEQVDNYTFSIEWEDGLIFYYHLDELQKRCPCAGCLDERTGERIPYPNNLKKLKAVRITNVGRYAIRIQFTHGCSNGIYDFDMLRNDIGNL